MPYTSSQRRSVGTVEAPPLPSLPPFGMEGDPRAARDRLRKEIVGPNPELVVAETVTDSDAELTDVPPGATVKLHIVSLKGVGAGAPSEVIGLQAA